MKKENLFIGLTASAFIFLAILIVIPSLRANEIETQGEYVGTETCMECHEDMQKSYELSAHAATEKQDLTITGCEACHGPGSDHVDEGGGPNIFAFKSTDMPLEKSKKCLNCHTRSNPRFMASPHGKASLDCTTCHSVHEENTKASPTKSCYSCHEDVFSEFQLNERHRLQEGILDCASCHNPHEPATRERLGGFKHQSCLKCHTDKGGPYLYEHGASRIEGCSSCHEVHGTPNRHMLTHQSTSDLCFSCHTAAVSWHSRFDSSTTNCTVCHATIHGSNLSKIFLK